MGGLDKHLRWHTLALYEGEVKERGGREWVPTCEAGSACAVVAAGHVLAGPAVHARVGLALVVVDVTVGAAPAGVTGTFVATTQRNHLVSGFISLHFQSVLFSPAI